LSAPAKKDPRLAGILSILPGLGQLYNGDTWKGVGLLVLGIALLYFIVTAATAKRGGGDLEGIEIAFFILVWIVNEYDAYTTAKTIAEGAT